MHINTHNKRIEAASAASVFSGTVRHSYRMIEKVWERWFSSADQKDIDAEEAQEIGDILLAVSNMLYDAITDFALETDCDVTPEQKECFTQNAKHTLDNIRIQELNQKLWNLMKTLPMPARHELDTKRMEACDMPDDQAIITMTKLMEEYTAE